MTISDGQLDGGIACALGAHDADGLVILLDGPAPAAWAVDAGAGGCEIERDLAQMGLRAAPAAAIELTGVSLAPALDGSDSRATAIRALGAERARAAASRHSDDRTRDHPARL